MKAEPQAQVELLTVQQLDTEIDQLKYRRGRLPERAELAEITKSLAATEDDTIRATTRVQDLQRELRKAEADVEGVRKRAERDQQLLNSGQVSASKQLSDLEHEIATLARRQADLEDAELEIMEQLEAAESDLAASKDRSAQLTSDRQRLAAQISAAEVQIDQDLADIVARRDAARSRVSDELLAEYDRLRADGAPVAAALLRYGRCGACQMELPLAELSEVRTTDPGEVVFCPECHGIMVRTEESGL